jgi:diguanylate cyclase (GGDEF)-like protein
LDIHTLHVEHVVLLALYTIITIANSSLYKGVKGIHWFSLYNLAAFLGAVAVAFRGHIPDFLSIVVGNLLVVSGYLFFSISLTAIFGSKTRKGCYLQAVLCLAAIVTMLQYGWLHNDTPRRLIAYSLILGCQQAQIVIFLLRQKRAALRVPTLSMAFMLACLALANLVRITGVTIHGAPHNYLNGGAFLAWVIIVNSGLQCGAIVSYVWMTAAHLREDLEVQASTDPLTRLLNRRAIEVAAGQQILACNRSSVPISAILLDLDSFKQINDTFGHHSGDATLIAVASCLQNGLRPRDLLARVGGDEFAILLPDTSLESATTIASQLQALVSQAVISFDQTSSRVTASFGVAQLQPPASTWEQLLMSCDKSLYEAKRSHYASAQAVSRRTSSLNFADVELS